MKPSSDKAYMRLALQLGRRGLGRTSPNPPVGAVVVKGGAVVGRGYHHRAGLPHAEVEALRDAGRRARGATVYITLEPCAHYGRTPPCTEALIAAGVRRVVFGARDPNPRVVGDGLGRLRDAGLAVAHGVEEAACEQLIAAFRKHSTSGLPLVTLKLAASLDGRIATRSGDSRWITNPRSRRYVHRLRDEHDAILVGAETVIRDDPELTCRLRGGRNPLRVVLDGRLRLPLSAKLVRTARAVPTIVVTTTGAPPRKMNALRDAGVTVWSLPSRNKRIAFRTILRRLGRHGVASLLIEGGANVASGALEARVVDRLLIFYAPKLIGGDGAPLLAPLGVTRLRQAVQLGTLQVRRFAGDILVATQVLPP